MDYIMNAIGFHLNGLNRIGVMMEIQTSFKCTKFPPFRGSNFIMDSSSECENHTILRPHTYYGETTGFQYTVVVVAHAAKT